MTEDNGELITRVMTTKLTLTLDDKVIQGAKRYAETKRRSVSELVEDYKESEIAVLTPDQYLKSRE